MKKITLHIFLLLFTLTMYATNSRYRLILTDDPATTIMIGWDQTSGTSPIVYYGTTDFGTAWASYPSSKTVDRAVTYKGMNNNFAKLSGLSPNTNYYFVINDSQGTSQRFWFRTAPNTNDTMSFISGGDSRNNRVPRQNANSLVAKLKPTAVFFGGDMTNGDSSAEWQDWFDDWQLTTAGDGRMFPIVPTRGNHEGSNSSIYDLFNVPSTDIYYKLTFGANLYSIYTLNSEIAAGGTQQTWLQNQLTTDTAIWKTAQYHKPMRPHNSPKSEGTDEYASWAQLFYDEGVRLVYESDSHTVKATWPIKPCTSGANCDEGFEREDLFGTVYVGEGCWGAPLRANDDQKLWTRDSASFNQFKWVCVSETQIDIKTIEVDGAASVSENTNNAVCTLPAGVSLWNPTNGDTISLTISSLEAPEVTITSHSNYEYLANGTNVTLVANATDNDGTIDYVDFIINGSSIGTDNSAPYDMLHTFADGAYEVEVVAYDNDALTASQTITIWVGDFIEQLAITVNNDVEQSGDDGYVSAGSSDLELVYDNSPQGYQKIAMRFTDVNIPPNASISYAYVQFTADGNYSNATELLVSVEDTANAEAILTNAYHLNTRSFSSAINWSVPSWSDDDAGADQRTPDFKAHIQNIVDNGSWVAKNAVLVKIEGTGVSLTNSNAKRRAESLESSGTSVAPVLHIEYSMNQVLDVETENINNEHIIYPNPIENEMFFKTSMVDNSATAEVYTLTGKLVLKSKIKDNQISLKRLNTGVYIVKVLSEDNETLFTKKILKK